MFWYFATPYTDHPDGREVAYREACENTALLVRHGVPVFCPIAHSHGMVASLPAEVQSHDFWMGVDDPFMRAAFGVIVCELDGWRESRGIAHEIAFFRGRARPIIRMRPGVLPCLTTLAHYRERHFQRSRFSQVG